MFAIAHDCNESASKNYYENVCLCRTYMIERIIIIRHFKMKRYKKNRQLFDVFNLKNSIRMEVFIMNYRWKAANWYVHTIQRKKNCINLCLHLTFKLCRHVIFMESKTILKVMHITPSKEKKITIRRIIEWSFSKRIQCNEWWECWKWKKNNNCVSETSKANLFVLRTWCTYMHFHKIISYLSTLLRSSSLIQPSSPSQFNNICI